MTYRSVDDIVATAVDAALVEPPSAPADVVAEIKRMEFAAENEKRPQALRRVPSR